MIAYAPLFLQVQPKVHNAQRLQHRTAFKSKCHRPAELHAMMDGTAPDPACLFVGAPGVGKATLIRTLQSSPEPKAVCPADYILKLDTRYYTADVAVQTVSTHQQHTQQQLPAGTWQQLQALVLVFDASSEASFVNVRSWADARETDSIEVKLLVANKADALQQSTTASSTAADAAGPHRAPWLQDAMAWCVEECFEYIEAAAGMPAVDAALQLDGEQQGVARVLAALQAHQWPGMLLKDWQPRKSPELRGAGDAAAAAAAAAAAGTSAGGSSSDSLKDQGRPAAAAEAAGEAAAAVPDAVQGSNSCAADSSATAGSTVAPAYQQQQQQQQQANNGTMPRQCGDANAGTTQQQQQQQQSSIATAPVDDNEASADLDDFEQMMKQMQGMRARLSHLPDEQRRSAAADVALKLASMWGLGDEDGSSDEGDAAAARADGQQQLDVRKLV